MDHSRNPGPLHRSAMPTAVHRADSTRSDRSDTSNRSVESRGSGGKKVSFSKAVRVKKFPRRHDSSTDVARAPSPNGEPSPEKRFWFKVYKNRHHQKPDIPDAEFETVVTTTLHKEARSSPTQASRSPHSKKRPDSPLVRRNHVRKIVQKFNREAELRQQDGTRHRSTSPPASADRSRVLDERVQVSTPVELQRPPKAPTSKKHPLVNGMRGIFAPLTRKRQEHHKSNGSETVPNGHASGSPVMIRSSILTRTSREDEFRDNGPSLTTQDVGIQVKPPVREEYAVDDIDCLYSRVDKSKKTSSRRSTSPPPVIYSSTPEMRTPSYRYETGSPKVSTFHRYASDRDERDKSVASSPTLSRIASDTDYGSIRRVKTSSRSFGFSLGQKDKTKDVGTGDDSDASSAASEPVVDSRPGSVLRGFDSRKKELSYENVSRLSDGPSHSDSATSTSGLWVRDADQDYRKGMAQNDVTVPSGGYIFTYSATLGKFDKKPKPREPSPAPEPVDRRPKKEVESPVKILVNGEDVTDRGVPWKPPSSAMSLKKTGGRSVCSDTTPVRGGLAAAYQARQRAAANGKPGFNSRLTSPSSKTNGGPGSTASSAVSEPAFCRDTVVLYIPGVSHHSKSSSLLDEPQGRTTVSRSQSVYQKNKAHNSPGNKQPKLPVMPPKARSETDLRRSKSIPRNTKFPWLRVKTTATPVH